MDIENIDKFDFPELKIVRYLSFEYNHTIFEYKFQIITIQKKS